VFWRWKNGKIEGWKDGKIERWKNGNIERWKIKFQYFYDMD
jgi:hypothetical protein